MFIHAVKPKVASKGHVQDKPEEYRKGDASGAKNLEA